MNEEIDIVAELQNWGRWLRSLPDPYKHLRVGSQPVFKMIRRPIKGTEWHNPDRAYKVNMIISMLANKSWADDLALYYSKKMPIYEIGLNYQESRRSTERRLAAARAAFEQKYIDNRGE